MVTGLNGVRGKSAVLLVVVAFKFDDDVVTVHLHSMVAKSALDVVRTLNSAIFIHALKLRNLHLGLLTYELIKPEMVTLSRDSDFLVEQMLLMKIC